MFATLATAALAIVRPYLFKLALGGAIALAFGSWTAAVSVKSYNRGHLAAINEIAAKDKEAVDAADKASTRLADCVRSGGVWDSVTGECGRG